MMKRLLAIIAVAAGVSASAQTSDFGMWTTLSVNKELGDKFGIGIDQELRLRDNLTTLNLIYTNIGASYKVTDYFKVSLVYRFIDKHKKDDLTWGLRHRGYIDLTFKVKPAKFTVAFRSRLQMEWRGAGYADNYGNIPEVFLRNQVKIGYKATDKMEPYVASEVRWQIQNPRIAYHNTVDRIRLIGGSNYEINKKNTIGAYFLFQQEFNVNDPETLYIIGLEYTINL